MSCRLFRIPLLFAAIFCTVAAIAFAAEPTKPLKIHLISGCTEYKSDESLSAFQKYLEDRGLAVCTRSFGKDSTSELPNFEGLDSCDVAIIFTRRITLPDEDLALLKKYVAAGKPLVGVRTASHAFQNFLELDKVVWGGNYKSHDKTTSGHVDLVEQAKGHPILRGIEAFDTPGRVYKNDGHADDIEVLLTVTSPEQTQPAAWARHYNGGRAFYTSLGQPDDFKNENFLRLLVNALFWVTDRKPPQ